MRALAEHGHQLALATLTPPPAEAIAGLTLEDYRALAENDREECPSPLAGLAERYRSYWGIPTGRLAAVATMSAEFKADCVVVVGLDVLPYLGGVQNASRIWYAADEWVWHHLSQVRVRDRSTWINLREAAVKGLYERAFASLTDRVWVVSEADGRAMRRVIGPGKAVIVPNGVDSEFFQPRAVEETERSCVFWGRLDFGPNIQAIQWFCRQVWPLVRQRVPDATFTIYGFKPTEPVQVFAGRDGISLISDLPDLRDEIARHSLVVLPFVSGGGIKNKLLEAASLAKAVVGSATALNGLTQPECVPMVCAKDAAAWVRSILELWTDGGRRKRLGQEARDWVVQNHSWATAARLAVAGLEN
jgi:glycosyltransferase involved in cell wall biosynthesis